MKIDDQLSRAFSAFQCGDAATAESLFKQLLIASPRHVAGLNLLGALLTRQGRWGEAEAYLKRAVRENSSSDATFYNYGLALRGLRRPLDAIENFDRALALDAGVAETWNSRGVALNDLERYQEAVRDFERAISLNRKYAQAYCNLGYSLQKLHWYDHAMHAYGAALEISPGLIEAWLGRGSALASLMRYDEALAAYSNALSLKSDLHGAWHACGNILYTLKRHEEAFAAYENALSLNQESEVAWLSRGNVCASLERYDEALIAYDRALSIKQGFAAAWLGRGNVLSELKRYDEALEAYDKSLAANPELAESWLGRGNLFAKQKRYDRALAAYDSALALNADLPGGWLGRANVLFDLSQHEQAILAYDKALSIAPQLAEAWLGRGHVLADAKHFEQAFFSYDEAFSIKQDLAGVEGARLFAKMNCCNWSNLIGEHENLIGSVRAGKRSAAPFAVLLTDASLGEQLQCANNWVRGQCAVLPRESPAIKSTENNKIRIGYMSADFRAHPVGYLSVGIFENRNRGRFEISGFSTGPSDGSEIRSRLENSFDRFIDLAGKSDDELIEQIRSSKIDILVDLSGHTQGARLAVLAARPAPLMVNFLGFAGTVGGDLLDYVIADRIVIPAEDRKYFSEKVVYLPDSLMPHDGVSRAISAASPTRNSEHLPADAFVFCCFNQAYKLSPRIFQSWMSILKRVDNSVLWLTNLSSIAKDNLRHEAEARGVDPSRLIFAERHDVMSTHLARHRLANLFLDTLPYNGHSTASDALWAGLPVLTQIGQTVAGRVAASLLHAVELPELIVNSSDEYEALAIALACDHGRLAAIKENLNGNRFRARLFNTVLFTKHLEAAYEEMYRREQTGTPRDHIEITPLNLA